MIRRISAEQRFVLAVVAVFFISAGTALANEPPVADAGPFQTIFLGDSVTLHGSATDPDGDPIMGWYWDVISAPAGSTYYLAGADTPDATFTTDTLGDYVITLIARDVFAWGDPDATLVTVVENQPPTAVAAASPLSGPAPLLVSFDGTGSSDPEGGPLLYDWNFGDGEYGIGATTVHTYDTPGIYSAILMVTDDHSNDDFDIIDITVCGVVYSGDFDEDCYVDFYDFSVLAAAWKSEPGDSNWNAACDISVPNDNVIDEFDLEVFAGNWLAGL